MPFDSINNHQHSSDDDGGTTLNPEDLNNITFPDPNQSDIQSAITNASPGERIVVADDWTLDNTLDIDDTDFVSVEFYGIVNVDSSHTGTAISFGNNGQTQDGIIHISSLNGPGKGSGAGLRVADATGWTCRFGRIEQFDKAINVHVNGSGREPFDWSVYGGRIQGANRAFEFNADQDYLQGWDVHGVNIFDIADTTVKHTGANRSTLHWFDQCTLHGNTDTNNAAEISYSANDPGTEANRYDCKFIGGSVSAKAESEVKQLN